jgi:polyphosphate kinase
MHIDDEFEGDILEKIPQGLRNRKRGVPSRFLYDQAMPEKILKAIAALLKLRPNDIIPGGRYHNFSDFVQFPKPDNPKLFDKPLAPLPIKELDEAKRLTSVIAEHDILLHYPYHSYEYVIRFLREAANDANVTTIKITLYRVANNSAVVEALKDAANNGKNVTAFIEVKARFDEESNLFWAAELERAGVTVLYSFPGLKVHAKLLIVTRMERDQKKRYAYLGTGNFNEKTATLYTDFGLFTASEKLTKEVNEVFRILSRKDRSREFKELLVAPLNMRETFVEWIDAEIANAQAGKRASIVVKLNSLEDPEMIRKLYKASEAGVKVRLIVRGICCLIPGIEGTSSNIKAISIVDRFLEHARVFVFHNGGDERILLGSADWMTRNLSSRIEVTFPLYDETARQTVKDVLDIQQKDNVKARVIAKGRTNAYRRNSSEKIRSQLALYDYHKAKK